MFLQSLAICYLVFKVSKLFDMKSNNTWVIKSSTVPVKIFTKKTDQAVMGSVIPSSFFNRLLHESSLKE